MLPLRLRAEFLTKHMRTTAIELCNKQNSGWAQRANPGELLEITYPTSDVQRALDAVSTSAGKPVVFIGPRGRGKSHIMALLHYAFTSPDVIEGWAVEWSARIAAPRLAGLKLQRGFMAVSETLSNQEYACLWEVIFERHPKGQYYRGKFEQAGTPVPAKSLLQDLFKEQHTALVLDEFQTWFDGLRDEPGDHGRKLRHWAFNFIQILSELAKERPDLLCLVVSVRDNTTEAYRQIHRDAPALVDFKGETAREDRKRLLLHRLFENRANFSDAEIEHVVETYASERCRLLFGDHGQDHARLRREAAESWPFAPELLTLLEDRILMAAAAQDKRDMIRILAEVFRARGASVPLLTAADFHVDDDACGVTSLLDSFATTADQEQLRVKAQRNLEAIRVAGVAAPHAREVISSLWMRSMGESQELGGTRNEVQLDITRDAPVDDNAFTAELAAIVDNSFNIHPVGTQQKRYCFKLPENPGAKLKASARNDRLFDPDTATAPGLMPVRRDQEYVRKVLNYVLKSPDGANEQPSLPIVLDPNWQRAPWANVKQDEQPAKWNERSTPVLIALPEAPAELSATLGPWLVANVPVNRNMVRFLLPKAGAASIYDDKELLLTARCALLASEWKESDTHYAELHRRYETELKKELGERFDRYALLDRWDFQQPANCTFHEEKHRATGGKIPKTVEEHVRVNYFAPEDFEAFAVAVAGRNETMRQLLALLRSEPLPGKTAIPYLGEAAVYEQVLRVAARGKIIVSVGNKWLSRGANESEDEAFCQLKQRGFRTGREMYEVQLGDPSQKSGGGVVVVAGEQPTGSQPGQQPLWATTGEPRAAAPSAGSSAVVIAPATSATLPPAGVQPSGASPNGNGSTTVIVAAPVIHRSLGAKSGINLLGDLERWALPDGQRVTQASLTISGTTVKELRELCARLPSKMLAELQITLPSEGGAGP